MTEQRHDTDPHEPDPHEPDPHERDSPEAQGTADAGPADEATGDIVIDSALQDLREAPADDLDAQIAAGRQVQETLQDRLGDLGGE